MLALHTGCKLIVPFQVENLDDSMTQLQEQEL